MSSILKASSSTSSRTKSKKAVNFKEEAWARVEAALQTVCHGIFPTGYYVKKGDVSQLYKILTVEVEATSQCPIPERHVLEANHLPEDYCFAHHPERKVERIDRVDVDVSANSGIMKVVKYVNPLLAKAGVNIKKGETEEQKFHREALPPGAMLERVEGVGHNSCRVKVSIQGDFPLHVYRSIFSREEQVILAQQVLEKLPEFSCDEVNNVCSCILTITTQSVCEVARIQHIAQK